jgi:hypothetical protein
MIRIPQFSIAVILLSVTGLGCSSEASRYGVSGEVKMDGAPAPYVRVVFHPTWSDPLAAGSAPTDEAGKFVLGESGKNAGFQAGEYKVTFSQILVNGKPTLAGGGGKKSKEETSPTERQAVADEYRDPQTTPITAKVGSGGNQFTFEIKAKK